MRNDEQKEAKRAKGEFRHLRYLRSRRLKIPVPVGG